MKRVLLHDNNSDRSAQMHASLRAGGYDPIVADDVEAVREAFARDSIPAVILGAQGNDERVLEILRAVRAGASRRAYVTLLTEDCPEEFLAAAYDAGADADLGAAHGHTLIVARLAAAERYRRRLAGSVQFDPPLSALERVAFGSTWRRASRTLEDATAMFLSLPARCVETIASEPLTTMATQILLSSTQEQLEVRIAVATDIVSARNMAVHMYGPDNEDLALDMLGELANIFMGSMKSVFGASAHAFTGGLPAPIDVEQVLRPLETYKHQETFALVVERARLIVHLGIRAKANTFVLSTGLREGMVLKHDVYNPRGILVINAGTRLSANMVTKLSTLLPATRAVEVMAS